jgi:hypothetical protein
MTHADGARYAYASGTSFSAPEVAGIAALVWSVKPSLTSAQIASVLEQTATRPQGAGWSPGVGWGVVNAAAAVANVSAKSTADSISLATLRISRPRSPGSTIEATVQAHWGDGMPVRVGATPSCRITDGGAALHAVPTLAAGLVTCAFTLPRGSTGKEVSGTVSVAAPGAATAAASFRFSVSP